MTYEIRRLSDADRAAIYDVINAAAELYAGVIPAAADTEPYMPMDELEAEMDEMQFYGAVGEQLLGVIGVQEVADVSLIRHLYVRPSAQRDGVGTRLLELGLEQAASERLLVGTWTAAEWALDFYEANGFENLGTRPDLLSTYWDVPDRQMEASTVLRYDR